MAKKVKDPNFEKLISDIDIDEAPVDSGEDSELEGQKELENEDFEETESENEEDDKVVSGYEDFIAQNEIDASSLPKHITSLIDIYNEVQLEDKESESLDVIDKRIVSEIKDWNNSDNEEEPTQEELENVNDTLESKGGLFDDVLGGVFNW